LDVEEVWTEKIRQKLGRIERCLQRRFPKIGNFLFLERKYLYEISYDAKCITFLNGDWGLHGSTSESASKMKGGS
jgi:hypothetical protein